ncbi:conserved Plasmodium protein, unknown function [Plasmodium gallinaceum]|uniref:Uncharacterized protein n=1 Tax=Plasmodium gallinaceum TaxID=5849 RepID=A0A1J1GNH3_PLAGA|nr:conserved Plasmodium protein, unknown function [Plasmodium gallinaceum]CRG94025.1 conserved Plasmodium protein, unknown function [Plasmodium gallinaceum]
MDEQIKFLLRNIKNNLIEKILLPKENIDVKYAINIIKIIIKKHIELNNNFLELFKKLDENLGNLNYTVFNSKITKSNNCHVLSKDEFLKKKKEEKILKDKLCNVENIIKNITTTFLDSYDNIKKIKELYLFFYMFIFKFSFDKIMFKNYIYGNNDINSNNKLTKISDNINAFISLNKISEYEFICYISKIKFLTKFYSNKDINKFIKICLYNNFNFNFLKEIKVFFFLTTIIYYIENDIKLKIKINNLIINNMYTHIINIKKYILILSYNPYISKMKKISNIF